uniref:Secreted protein n=1 Tax=Rhabditophanes sp. KR3021 TaxID=114890 RepID=A0AC35TJV2_9BILA
MNAKLLVFAVFLLQLVTLYGTDGAVVRATAKIGDRFEFDFSNNVKSVYKIKEGSEDKEYIYSNKSGLLGKDKAHLSSSGLLTIPKVSKSDFGAYSFDDTSDDDAEIEVAPTMLVLTEESSD